MDKLYNLTIDTKLKTYQKIYGMKQFENNVVLNITLVQNSVPLDLSGCTVRLNYQNKNEVLLQMANIISEKEGKVRVTVLTKVLDTIGDTPVDISVFDSEQRKITSSTFVLVVQESIYSNDKVEQEELDLIQDIYNKEKERQEAENTRKDNENKRILNELERASNESTRENQEKERQSNELERIKNENLRKTDEQQRVKQETKREDNEKIRITGEDSREKSMSKIQDDWQVIKDDLLNLEGGGDMMKSIYDTNKNGVVDNSEKLGGKSPEEYIQKNAGTTWDDINTNESVETGDTPALGLSRPDVSDRVLLKPINDNFTKLDSVLHRLGATDLPTYYDIYIDSLQTPGRYLIYRLNDAPDVPPRDSRIYLINVICVNKQTKDFFYEIDSLGTGKKYTYRNKEFTEIPTRSALQPDNIYIDAKNGSDENDGSKEHPIKTWKCMVSRLPKILSKPVTITLLSDLNEYCTLCNYRYCGDQETDSKINIQGNNHNVLHIDILNSIVTGASYGISLTQLQTTRCNIYDCSSVLVYHCSMLMLVSQGSCLECNNCEVGQYNATRNAVICVSSHINPDDLSQYGCNSSYGSLIYVQGNKPQGTVNTHITSTGGKVEYED